MPIVSQLGRGIIGPITKLIYRPTIEGRDNFPPSGPIILASNHLSFIDSVLLPVVAPRPVSFFTKAQYFQGKGLTGLLSRWFFTSIDAIPVERTKPQAAQAALEQAIEVLNAGNAFGIYPEGTRSTDGRLYRGRTGVAWVALTTRAPVIPVAVIGTNLVQPIGAKIPRIVPVKVRFGQPIHFGSEYGTADSAKSRRVVTDEIMEAIAALSGQERANVYHPI